MWQLPQVYPIDLGSKYSIDYDAIDDIALFKNSNRYVIEGHVLSYAFDDDYIVAKQKPRADLEGCEMGDGYESCEKAFKESTLEQFWIVNKIDGSKFGPFSVEEYRDHLKKFEILTDNFLAIIDDEKSAK